MIRKCILIMIFITFTHVSTVFSTIYYVDFTNGSDANNGTAIGTAFKHCPGDPNATNIAASTTPTGTDKVIFKGGVIYILKTGAYSAIVTKASGTSSTQTITYDGNTAGTFGTGRAVIDGESGSQVAFIIGHNNITITGFEIRNLAVQDGSGAIIPNRAVSYIYIANNLIHDVWSGNTAATPQGSAIRFYSLSDHIYISGNTIYNTAIGIQIINGTYFYIYNNDMTDKIMWGISASTYNNNLSNIYIYNNTLHDIYFYDGKGPHTDFIFIYTADAPSIGNMSGVYIYSNTFYNTATFIDYGGTGMITVQNNGAPGYSIDTIQIYNNVFYNWHSYPALALGKYTNITDDVSNFKIFNNTFYSTRAGCYSLSYGGKHTGMNEIKNNIFFTGVDGSNFGAIVNFPLGTASAVVANYNCYRIGGGIIVNKGITGGPNYTWAQWQASGQESNGLGPIIDPYFVSPGILASSDFRLMRSSTCKDAGVNLSSYFTTDKDGNPRPRGYGWDIGAYEYNKPEPPVNLRIQTH